MRLEALHGTKMESEFRKIIFFTLQKKNPFFALFLGSIYLIKKTNEAILIILVKFIARYVLKILCKFKQNQLTSF